MQENILLIMRLIFIILTIIFIILHFTGPSAEEEREAREKAFDEDMKKLDKKITGKMVTFIDKVKNMEREAKLFPCIHKLEWCEETRGYECPQCQILMNDSSSGDELWNLSHCELCGDELDMGSDGYWFCYQIASGHNSIDGFEIDESLSHCCEDCKFKIDDSIIWIKYLTAKNKYKELKRKRSKPTSIDREKAIEEWRETLRDKSKKSVSWDEFLSKKEQERN